MSVRENQVQADCRSKARTSLHMAAAYQRMCEDIISDIEFVYLTIPPSVAQRYSEALETRNRAITTRLNHTDAWEVMTQSQQVFELMGRALSLLILTEHLLFPERPMRQAPVPEPLAIMAQPLP